MELFKNTNFDFLGKKWPFIGLSLVLTAAGLISLAVKGGADYGIDFKGGAQMSLRFNQEPPVQKIRAALESKIRGEISVQQVTGKPEVLVGTEIKDEKELNANRQIDRGYLARRCSAPPDGKLDLNNSSADGTGRPAARAAAAGRRGALRAGFAGSGEGDRGLSGPIKAASCAPLDQLSGVKGVTPQGHRGSESTMRVWGRSPFLSADVVGPKIGAELRRQAILATLYALGGMLVYIAFRFEWIYGVAAVVAVFHDTHHHHRPVLAVQ